jgi:L,D-transpeptidase catalytic domain
MRFARYPLRLLAALAAFPIWEASAEDQKKQIFTWQPERSRSGPILIIVNIDDQVAFVYRNGIQIGQTPVSTGRPGYPTPTGVFSILGKDATHRSKKYNNAAMPFAERLTWSGIFLHAGDLPGYPASHGCVHLPLAFAKDLFETTQSHDTTVVITESTSHPTETGPIEQLLRIVEGDAAATQAPSTVLWEPDKSKDGSAAIVISGLDKRIEILRGGVLIGQAPISFVDPKTSLPEALYVKLQPSPGKPAPDWSAVLIAGSQTTSPSQLLGEIQVPAPISNELSKLLVPGTLLITTPGSLTPENRSATNFVGVQASAGSNPSP